jgi:type I restriction enzyme S subunit
MVRLVGGSASPHINVGAIKSVPAILPPYSLQERFSKIVRTIDSMREKHFESLLRQEALVCSLQQRAFNGELFSDNPQLIEVN